MKKIKNLNLLKKIYEKYLSPQEGEKIILKITSSHLIKNWGDTLGLSKNELKAYTAGVDLKTLSKWRFEGWPDKCFICQKEINFNNGNWWVLEMKDKKYVIKHFKCKNEN